MAGSRFDDVPNQDAPSPDHPDIPAIDVVDGELLPREPGAGPGTI